jgi:hypothetical protein
MLRGYSRLRKPGASRPRSTFAKCQHISPLNAIRSSRPQAVVSPRYSPTRRNRCAHISLRVEIRTVNNKGPCSPAWTQSDLSLQWRGSWPKDCGMEGWRPKRLESNARRLQPDPSWKQLTVQPLNDNGNQCKLRARAKISTWKHSGRHWEA